MYIIILRAALAGTAPHGREGFYFGESGEYRLLDAAKVYTAALHELGKSKTPEPTTYTKEDIDKYLDGVRTWFWFDTGAIGILTLDRVNILVRTRSARLCVQENSGGTRPRQLRISTCGSRRRPRHL